MSLSQSVVHVMASLQPWFSMQSIVGLCEALNTNPRVFVTYNSGSLRYICNCLLAECIACNVPQLA